MKRFVLAGALALAALPAFAQVSVSVGSPGLYGRIDLGGFPQPELVQPRPVIIQRGPTVVEPIYLRVPPGHQKHWSRYCARYQACGAPVYFVREDWYQRVYEPRRRGEGRFDDRRDHGNHDDRGDHDRGRGRDDNRGNGRGRGNDR